MWYFLPFKLDPDTRQRIAEARIPIHERALQCKAGIKTGLLVDEGRYNELMMFLQLVELDPAYREVRGDGQITVIEPVPRPDHSQLVVNEDASARPHISESIMVLLRSQQVQFDCKLVVRVCGGRGSSLGSEHSALHIRLHSKPDAVPVAAREGYKAFDKQVIPLAGNLSEYQLIHADNCPDPVALLQRSHSGATLWITFDLQSIPDSQEVLEFILQYAASCLNPEGYARKTWREWQYDIERRRYIALCRARLAQEQESLTGSIEQADQRLNQARATFMAEYAAMQALQRRQQALAEGDQAVIERYLDSYAREYDMLVNSPSLQEFQLTPHSLTFTTIPLEIKHQRTIYEVGCFTVSINLANGAISIKGKHPHVQDGRPCLGNIKSEVAMLTVQRKYGVLVMLLIRYLESVDVDDQWGARIFAMGFNTREES